MATANFDTSVLEAAVGAAAHGRGAPQLAEFAAGNGMVFTARGDAPGFSGSMFDYIQNGHVSDRFSSLDGRLDVGNITGSPGGSQSTTKGRTTVTISSSSTEVRSYGYLALKLERALPQFVLDARSNDSVLGSNLPMTIARGQRLSLEGDFDRYFTLHAPKGYETDALYVFTPDLMALLIDETNTFDVEIVDDWLFVYANDPLEFHDPTVWQRIARIRDVVWSKALSQTRRYRDDRSASPAEVGAGGRRLRQGFGFAGGRGKFLVIGIIAAIAAMFVCIGAILIAAFSAALG